MISKNQLVVLISVFLLVFVLAFSVYAQEKLVISGTPQADEFYKKIAAKFEQLTGTKVEFNSLPREEWDGWFKARISGNVQLDIIQLDPLFQLEYADKGLIINLSDAFKDEKYPNLKEDRFKPGMLDMFTLKGVLSCVPMNVVYNLYYYNKVLFEKNGLTIPRDPVDIYNIADKFKNTGVEGFAFAGKERWWYPGRMYEWLPYFTGGDAQNYTIETILGKRKWSDPRWVACADMFAEQSKKGFTQLSLGLDYAALMTGMLGGKIAMLPQFSGFYAEGLRPTIIEGKTEGFDLGMFPRWGGPTGGADVTIAVTSICKNKDLAFQFLDFAASEEAAKVITDLGYISSIQGVDPADPYMKEIVGMYTNQKISRFNDHWWEPEIVEEVIVQMTDVFMGNKSALEAMESVEIKAEELRSLGRDRRKLFE